MNKRIEAAEALANAVEDYIFTTGKDLDKLRAAWQAYVDVADEDTAVVAVVDAGELERLRQVAVAAAPVVSYELENARLLGYEPDAQMRALAEALDGAS